VPGFLQELFLDSATGAVNVALGAEFTYRKDNFDIVGQLWWAGYSNYGPYRASGDPDTDTEMIDSSLSVLFLSAAFLWSTPFNDVLALEYGVDVGIGVVLGNVYRTEAFPDAGGGQPRSTDGYAPCNAPGDGRNTTYCDGPSVPDGETGGHYNAKVRRWSDGGNLPNVVPWLAIPHLALRIKPVKQLMMRVEGGFGIGFFLGFSAAYGFQ